MIISRQDLKLGKTQNNMTFMILLFSFLIMCSNSEGIKERKESEDLRILMVKDDWWPFFQIDSTGQLYGINITIAERICKALDVQPVFIRKVFLPSSNHL